MVVVAPQRAVHGPGCATVIAREDDEGLLRKAVPPQGVEHFAHAPVHLLDPIPIQAVRGFAAEPLSRIQRKMHGAMRKVQEETFVLVRLHESQRLLGVPGDQLGLILRQYPLQDRFPSHQRQWRLWILRHSR